MNSKISLRALTEGAVFVALAVVVGKLKLFELPQGGSVNLAMLPIFIYCARWGFKPAMLASFVYSLLKLSFDEETLESGSIRCPKCGELLEFDLGSDAGDKPD